jgi:hypothetical protein
MAQDETSSIITSSGEAPSATAGHAEGAFGDVGQALESGAGRLLGSAVLIGAGVLVEPELVGGALLGAGVLYALPLIGRIARPLLNTAVRVGYSAVVTASDVVSQAGQQVQNIVADARSQYQQPGTRSSGLVR